VIICITATEIFCGSVGDSRGIIGTTATPEVLPAPPANLGEERRILAEVKRKRKSLIGKKINSIQLTRDQKPEDPEENKRILKAGGRVQRLKDEFGNEIGPYRVWKRNENAPGLAMSRSIGDGVAKSIGVISEPVLTSYKRTSEDLFVVIASDGVWDAMDNKDVGTFVECNRGRCKKGAKSKVFGKEVHFGNACIAQILCEEARLRWFTIVEEEDVIIDDISCIVIEIKRSNEVLAEHSKGLIPKENAELKATDDHSGEGANTNRRSGNANIRDPRRGSSVENRT
jgi:serine/threonine protein phosphatase PrpC